VKLVSLTEYKNRELVAVLRELLELAEGGAAHGLAFVVKLGRGDHRAGMAGDYKRRPEEALSATFLLERHLMKGQTPFDADDEEESGT
jgi:hypothetical protein